tara:strand:- start:4140 stop:4838 length:699 start_codon:yes stop_codon:yes gene_type:complete
MLRILSLCLIISFWSGNSQPADHNSWTEILQIYVSDKGEVNYKELRNNKSDFENYLETLAANTPSDEWETDTKKAYWINAYNAFTIQLILENYPIRSVKDIKRPWSQNFIKVGEKTLSLNTIEHKILRPMGDPRIHFAIVCASESCPKLLNYAYESKTLHLQLEKVTKQFINDSTKNTINQTQLKISRIFKWFESDFPKKEAFISFLNNYNNIKISVEAKIEYLNYSWKLNE